MSCGAGGCASGGCGRSASQEGRSAGGCGVSGVGGCSSGGCGPAPFDGTYRDVVGVQIGLSSKTWYFDSTGFSLDNGELCVVDTDHGEELAKVVQATGPSRKFAASPNLRKVLRTAEGPDLDVHEKGRSLSQEALEFGRERIAASRLEMKLVDADPSFDGRRMTVTFTSEERIDFRDLVRDFSQKFRRRIEMRQIGARDEAKFLGGYGACGRPICCSTFLKEFPPISIKMAKRQGIGMNPSKISGLCGRLMCCLRYEDYDDPRNPVKKAEPAPAPAS